MEEKFRDTLAKTPHPQTAGDFQAAAHLPCLNQGRTYVCWSFATVSFLESEMARLKLEPVRLSVSYPVYCAYLEKARRLVRTRGESRFAAGDLFTGLFDVCREYGALPAAVYDKPTADGSFDQTRLYAELDRFLAEVKLRGDWDESRVLAQLRKILDRHLGPPPERFPHNGRTYTPASFLAEVVRLPWNDYVMLISSEAAPFEAFTELKVEDNWRHNTNFFNVPLPRFYESLKGALRSGFSAVIDMDITEPSYQITSRYCLIPASDCPAGGINQAAREWRLRDGATTDDHAAHLVGYRDFDGQDWFLAKDSWKVAWRDGNRGMVFLHRSYVELKVLAFLAHRDGVPEAAVPRPVPRPPR